MPGATGSFSRAPGCRSPLLETRIVAEPVPAASKPPLLDGIDTDTDAVAVVAIARPTTALVARIKRRARSSKNEPVGTIRSDDMIHSPIRLVYGPLPTAFDVGAERRMEIGNSILAQSVHHRLHAIVRLSISPAAESASPRAAAARFPLSTTGAPVTAGFNRYRTSSAEPGRTRHLHRRLHVPSSNRATGQARSSANFPEPARPAHARGRSGSGCDRFRAIP